MADVGSVVVKIDADSSGFKSAMGGLGKLGSAALKGTAVAAAGVTTAIGAIGKSAISAYADYEQLVGGVDTLFGTGGKSVEQWANEQGVSLEIAAKQMHWYEEAANTVLTNADNAYKTAGLSANQYMETVTSFAASLVSSLGGDTTLAAEYADTAITDMADNANKMGTDISRIQDAYQGFAKQNYTIKIYSLLCA